MTIRQNCKWIQCNRKPASYGGITFEVWDHPALLSALRELGDYQLWVEERLIPIVSKWIDENRERVIDGMSQEQMNDMGAAVEKAYELLVKDGYIATIATAVEEGEHEDHHPIAQRNPLWQSETKRRRTRP